MPVFGDDNFYDVLVALVSPVIQMTADYAGQIALPFARYVELGDTYTYFTKSDGDLKQRQVISESQFQISIFASTRDRARKLGRHVMNVIDDYATTYQDGRIMRLEPVAAIFIPEPRPGPSVPAVFHRAITFALTEQRII